MSTAWEDKGVEVIIKVGVPPEIKGRDVSFDVHAGRVTLQARGETLLSGDTEHAIDPDTSLWFLEEDEALGRVVEISLAKRSGDYAIWTRCFEVRHIHGYIPYLNTEN